MAAAVLDGLTITGGIADGAWPYNLGGGLYVSSFPGLVVANCVFTGNSAERGGGICVINTSPVVRRCVFTGNAADYGAGLYMSTSSARGRMSSGR